MLLPITPQEFTLFALEQSGHAERFYLRTVRYQTQYTKQQVRAWVKVSAKHAPEVFDVEHVQDGSVKMTSVSMAGVPVMCIMGHHELASTLEAFG